MGAGLMTALDRGVPIRWRQLTCPYCGARLVFLEWWEHVKVCDAGLEPTLFWGKILATS